MNEDHTLLVFKLTLDFGSFSSIALVLSDDFHYLNLKRGHQGNNNNEVHRFSKIKANLIRNNHMVVFAHMMTIDKIPHNDFLYPEGKQGLFVTLGEIENFGASFLLDYNRNCFVNKTKTSTEDYFVKLDNSRMYNICNQIDYYFY